MPYQDFLLDASYADIGAPILTIDAIKSGYPTLNEV
jgi:hypothetical protein